MKILLIERLVTAGGGIESAGVPALRVAFTIAAVVFIGASIFIVRKRLQCFDRDPDVPDGMPVVRHDRQERITFAWGSLTLVLLGIGYQAQTT